jgi:hypothetical protein
MGIKYTYIFHSKPIPNLPKLGFLVRKYTIWQPWHTVMVKITKMDLFVDSFSRNFEDRIRQKYEICKNWLIAEFHDDMRCKNFWRTKRASTGGRFLTSLPKDESCYPNKPHHTQIQHLVPGYAVSYPKIFLLPAKKTVSYAFLWTGYETSYRGTKLHT